VSLIARAFCVLEYVRRTTGKEMLVLKASTGFAFVPPKSGNGVRVMRLAVAIAMLASAIVAGSLTGAASAQASSSPSAATDGVSVTGPTSARVSGNGDPEGESTTVHADYALASDLWCTSGGKEGAPAETTPEPLGSGSAMVSEILVTLEGLTPSSEYCAELVATNASGTAYGGQVRFTTPPKSEPLIPPVILQITAPITAPSTTTHKPLTNGQRLARALRACRHKPKKQRAVCVKLAHEKYGKAARKARKSRK
jgi:hypothetical protein